MIGIVRHKDPIVSASRQTRSGIDRLTPQTNKSRYQTSQSPGKGTNNNNNNNRPRQGLPKIQQIPDRQKRHGKFVPHCYFQYQQDKTGTTD